jgi:hypothetical protein
MRSTLVLKPEDKQRLVQELKQRGAKVAVAGDGINDAPALAAADVRFAMRTGNGCGDSKRRTLLASVRPQGWRAARDDHLDTVGSFVFSPGPDSQPSLSRVSPLAGQGKGKPERKNLTFSFSRPGFERGR